jgi:hypothetical protein
MGRSAAVQGAVDAAETEETLQPESAMKSRKALTLGSLVVVFAFATTTQAQDKKPTAKGIDPATVATYE